jgi:hypothetical protein
MKVFGYGFRVFGKAKYLLVRFIFGSGKNDVKYGSGNNKHKYGGV